jgi:hypothetical protein
VRCAAVLVLVCIADSVAHGEAGADLAAIVADLPTCDAGRGHCIGIRLHVVVTDEGMPIAASDWLAAQLAAANRHFAPLDVGFQVAGIEAVPPSAAHIATARDRDDIAANRLRDGVVDVFIVSRLDDIDREGQTIRGVTWHTRNRGRKYVIVSTVAVDRVLAHELGHVFGLPHSTYPISIMNKRERKQPSIEQRTFADDEIAAMRPTLARLLRDKVIVEIGVASGESAR